MGYSIEFYKSKEDKLSIEEVKEIYLTYEDRGILPELYGISLSEHIEIVLELKTLLPTFESYISKEKGKSSFLESQDIEKEYAIQIEIYDYSASLSFPFWYEGEDLERIWLIIEAITNVFSVKFGLWGYDSQSGTILDVSLVDQKIEFVKISAMMNAVVQKRLWGDKEDGREDKMGF